jgi:cytidyltransferase-like protein
LFTVINREVIRESAGKIGWYPGSFKPLHNGHYKSILRAAGLVSKLHVLVSLQDRIRPNEFPVSGAAAKQYIETYIAPTVPGNVQFSFIDGSPITYLLRTIPPNSVVFAGKEELEEYTPAFQKYAPASKVQMASLPEVSREGTPGGERVFGGGVRRYIRSGDVAGLASVLPDIPEVQTNIEQIMNLFRTTGAELMNKKQNMKKKADLIQEMIGLIVEEILLTEAKRKKSKFPKKYEPLIMKLKKRYGDPTEMDSGPEKKKAGALVFGTVQNIMKRKKKA